MQKETENTGTVPFSITARNFEWISGQMDDPQDLCSHGNLSIQIGSDREFLCQLFQKGTA